MSLTQSSEYPWRFQGDPQYNAQGALSSAVITQFYRSDIVDSTSNAVISQAPSNPSSLTVDLVANGTKTVVLGGVTYTYAQALAIIQGLLAQERAAQLAALKPAGS